LSSVRSGVVLLPLKGGPLWRLRQLEVVLEQHVTPQLLQHGLDGEVALPAEQDGDGADFDRSVGRDAAHVDSGDELDDRGLVRVFMAAGELEAVHAVLEGGPRGSNNHSLPVDEVDVVLVLQPPADGSVANALLTGLQLLEETEAAGHHRLS